MTVHFIGAGPGAADLITVRGRDLIARCAVCLYAGSLVPREVIACAPAGSVGHGAPGCARPIRVQPTGLGSRLPISSSGATDPSVFERPQRAPHRDSFRRRFEPVRARWGSATCIGPWAARRASSRDREDQPWTSSIPKEHDW